jgi:Protein of unknown function (DUF1460)
MTQLRYFTLSILLLVIAAAYTPVAAHGIAPERSSDAKDSLIFVEKLALARATPGTIAAKTLAVMRSFEGTPYVGGTLEAEGPEHLVINLQGLDCWTSVEVSLAIALTADDPAGDYDRFKQYVRTLRYWGGTIDGYGSRIHYFTGWVLQAEKLGFVEDLTAALGGEVLRKKVTFMTDNPISYPELADSLTRKRVVAAQDRINGRTWHYIPKKKVASVSGKIETGDIIVLVSSKSNLDVEHQGFAVRDPKTNQVHLLHASSTGKKVLVSGQTLHEYINRIPAMSGIMIIRIR